MSKVKDETCYFNFGVPTVDLMKALKGKKVCHENDAYDYMNTELTESQERKIKDTLANNMKCIKKFLNTMDDLDIKESLILLMKLSKEVVRRKQTVLKNE